METRGRGSEARSTVDETPSSNHNPTTNASFPSRQPPSTRSRTRLRARATRHSSTAAASGSLTAQRISVASTRSRRATAARRAFAAVPQSASSASTRLRPALPSSAAQPLLPPARSSSGSPPSTRKRTRSVSRRQSGQASASGQASSSGYPAGRSRSLSTAPVAASASNGALPTRPLKRPKRTSPGSRYSRFVPNLAGAGRATAGPGFLRRAARDMDPTNDAGERQSELNEQRGYDDGPRSLGSDRAGPATLQGLLRRLGADLSDIFPRNMGTSHSRLQQLRSAISSPDSDGQQIDALSELCEFLSVGTEESLVSFSVNLFVSPLVNLLRTGTNIEIKIYAARALTHMMEALPSSSSSVANHGAAEPLCQNLLSIEYIDLAEQSLSALHKLSVDYPQQIVSANGFQAVLSFIDFFSLGVQRVAAATACNLCRLPRADAMDMISGVLPTMMRLLDSEDQRIRESTVLGFTRLAESFRCTSAKLETLCGDAAVLIEKVFGLIIPSSPPALAPQSYASALRLLAILSRGSATLALQILSTKSLIQKLNMRLSSESAQHSVDCLVLVDSLLPDLPGVEGTQPSAARSRRRRSASSTTAFAAIDTKRRQDLEKNMDPLLFFGQTLFATLMKLYVSSADSNARRLALSSLSKYICIAPQIVLFDVIVEREGCGNSLSQKANAIRFCPFVASLLGENSSQTETLVGLAMADSTLQKLPSLRESYIREGVVHEIVRLAVFDDGSQRSGEGTGEALASTSSLSNAAVEPERHGEDAARVSSDHVGPFFSLRGMESIWGAVAASQRSAMHRDPPGDFVSAPRQFPSCPPDTCSPDMHSLQALVPKAAISILRTHLGAQEDGSMDEKTFKNARLGSLTKICSLLRAAKSSCEQAKGVEALSNLFELLTASGTLTVFEISKSGIMEALASYLSPSDAKLKSARIVALIQCLNKYKVHGAFSCLVDLALGVLSAEEKFSLRISESSASSISASVSSGLRQLAQPFKLRLRKAPSGRGSEILRDYSHHVVLIEPLATMASVQDFLWPRVRESDRGGVTGLKINARRPLGQTTHTGHTSSAPGQDDRRRTTGSGEGNGDQVADEIDEDRYADEAIFDMEGDNNEEEMVDEDDHNSDPSDVDASSGEEDVIEQDVGEGSDQDPDGADSFDVEQLSTALPPFELDHDTLGQAPSRVTRQPNGSTRDAMGRASSASHQANDPATAFRSYAAALAANMPRSFDRISIPGGRGSGRGLRHADRTVGARVPPAPKLSFILNGKAVPHDWSILSAVIQCSAKDRGIGPWLWSDVHSLVYSKAEIQPTAGGFATQGRKPGTRADEKFPENVSKDRGGPVRRSQRLQKNREKGQTQASEKNVAGDTDAPDHMLSKVVLSNGMIPVPCTAVMAELSVPIASVIEVLTQLHWVYEKMNAGRLRKEGILGPPEGLREDSEVQFYSNKLTAKLIRQLSDPVALCGGVIPNWCFSLSRDASFLIPFEARRILFQSTSLGIARALHLLQARVDISGVSGLSLHGSRGHRDTETRIARIQRQKVRMHRNRILESAIKVMSMYGAHTTMLEVEYFDEAGTGLGPTLEFYTLASREVQRADLGLWRGSAAKVLKRNSTEKRTGIVRSNKAEAPSATGMVKRRSRRHAQNTTTLTKENVVGDEDSPAYVIPTGHGLFPSCLPIVANDYQKEASEKIAPLYAFIGRLLGKAMIDGRLLDLRFSKAFCRLLLAYCRVFYEKLKSGVASDLPFSVIGDRGRGSRAHPELDAGDKEHVWDIFTCGTSAMKILEDVDPLLASSLQAIVHMVRGGQGDAVENLSLTFVLPGDDDIELVKHGKEMEVTGTNAEEFVQRVVYHVIFGGVQQQAEALLQGLGEVLDVTSLLAFKFDELDLLICGPSFENWTIDFLVQVTRCDHGYSHESPSVLYFLRILSEMDQADQQRFVMFATGSPALPLGGLKNLHPRLTIVRRAPEAGRSPDECLPTVMTCTNYFKLPDYSSLEIARKQVVYAVREGQGSFHLS